MRGQRHRPATPASNVLLFALTGNARESKTIMRHVAALPPTQRSLCVVRLNPNTSSYPHLARFAKTLGLVLYDPAQPVVPTICFFRSSSVAVDYLAQNAVPVYMRFDDDLSNNTFELDNRYEFETIALDDDFTHRIGVLLERYRATPFTQGVEMSNYYLDQTYGERDFETFSQLLRSTCPSELPQLQ